MGQVIDKLLPPSLSFAIRREVLWGCTRDAQSFKHFWYATHLGDGFNAFGAADNYEGAYHDAEEEEKEGRISYVHLETEESTWETLLRNLIQAMTFEVYNKGEWVLRRGMLNEKFFVVAAGSTEVLLNVEDTTKGFAVRRSSGLNVNPKSLDFFGKVIAEHRKGEIFGEISCMFRKKCEASVRARTSLDVISLPRKEMMEVLSKNDQMKSDFLKLIQTRRMENKVIRGRSKTDAAVAHAAKTLGRYAKKHLHHNEVSRRQTAAACDDSSTREQVEHDSDNSFKEMSGSSALNGEKARLHSLKDLNSERYCSERSWSAPTLLSHTVSGRSSAPGLSSRETLETAVEEDEDVEQGHSFLSNAWSRPNGAPSTLPPWAFSSDNRHPSVARQLVGVEETTCSTPTASAPAVAEGDEEMTTPGLTGDNALLTSLLTA